MAFAELEHFIDNQVKFYSSGMYVRLGFAVAVNVEPDILVIDEVLAVGDEDFQRKCLARIKQFQDDGRTILFVTHSSELVRQICDRAVVLSSGGVIEVGPAAEAIKVYHDHLLATGTAVDVPLGPGEDGAAVAAHRPIRITGLDLEHPGSGSRPYLLPNESLSVHILFEASEPVDDVVFAVEVIDQRGELVFATDTDILGQVFDAPLGSGRADLTFERVSLLQGGLRRPRGHQEPLRGGLQSARARGAIRGHEPRPLEGQRGPRGPSRHPGRHPSLSGGCGPMRPSGRPRAGRRRRHPPEESA